MHALFDESPLLNDYPQFLLGLATEAKPDVGHGKTYQVPEYFKYNQYSYFDVEKDMVKDRVPQPKSGLSEFW